MNLLPNIPEIPNIIHYAIPFFILTLVIEILISAKKNMASYYGKGCGGFYHHGPRKCVDRPFRKSHCAGHPDLCVPEFSVFHDTVYLVGLAAGALCR